MRQGLRVMMEQPAIALMAAPSMELEREAEQGGWAEVSWLSVVGEFEPLRIILRNLPLIVSNRDVRLVVTESGTKAPVYDLVVLPGILHPGEVIFDIQAPSAGVYLFVVDFQTNLLGHRERLKRTLSVARAALPPSEIEVPETLPIPPASELTPMIRLRPPRPSVTPTPRPQTPPKNKPIIPGLPSLPDISAFTKSVTTLLLVGGALYLGITLIGKMKK